MEKFIKRTSKKAGAPPGTLVHIGEKREEKTQITLINYDAEQLQERVIDTIEEVFPLKELPTVTWINIDGLHQIDIIEKTGRYFNIHPLVLEDILNTGQRPKAQEFEDCIFVVLKMLYYNENLEETRGEQFSLVLGENYLISFQETHGDVFNTIRDRIRNPKTRMRKAGCDYLAYTLIDAIVDNYFIILETLGETIETLEDELLENPGRETLHTLHEMKREMIYMRKQIWPIREIINTLIKSESPLINESTRVYFKDIYDHTIQVIDTIESYRDFLAGMLDIYLSTVSNKMNEIMKVLTMIATIFIPITFIAGIYGMNFKYMPELEWRWGYFLLWGIIAVIVAIMIVFFKKRDWI
ncbi:MAG: magnesium/cobalt transporter CorA [Desulfobacterales bacterium]|uniref:Magnesium transport protein CorA n=1 Tax=Candidatus Desulfatibia profunda TaxID=2841695 RepID=A0A8J6NU83_9BACT|nr:magnesium/cobalt transporter CorA [Candidatus Desulfatibia profunda]MBL7179434.1 magnesium/cobalt transporter CorA [Desulfobacterales bacterium]